MPSSRGYQFNFSQILTEAMYDREAREKKAKTIIAVLSDYFRSDFKSFSVLDVGCSTGFIANYLSNFFGQVLGIDIDESAIDFAKRQFRKGNLDFIKSDSQKVECDENTFDVVICTHIYEHVPDAGILMKEIFRILKPNGVCYFSAGNRLKIMEPHYHLPFLSILPRPLAHLYIRASRKHKYYYEKHLSYWGLMKLVRDFEVIDYTKKIIRQPEKFKTEYMIQPDTNKARLARFVVKNAYWLCPTYVWLLHKQ